MKNILHKTCKCGAICYIFAAMKEYKTIKRISRKTGLPYRAAIRQSKPRARVQQCTYREGLAVVRLLITKEQYEQVQAAAADVARAMGYAALSAPDTIVIAAAISTAHLSGTSFRPASDMAWAGSLNKPPGRRPIFQEGHANVVLKMSPGLVELLTEHYDTYCILAGGLEQLPRTGPVWAAFLHGVQVIRESVACG